MRALVVAAALAAAAPLRADPVVTLRMATVAPDGTAWAREVRAFDRDVEALTHGAVRMKWYFGAIAGDEMDVVGRIRRGQLDGQAGAQFCERLAPSLRVVRILGLFHEHGEAQYVLGKLGPVLEQEFAQAGFVDLGVGTGFGETIFLTREPVRSLAELRKLRVWIWDLDDVPKLQLPAMGIPAVPIPVHDAARAYDERRTDGFLTIPMAALAFQWSAQARWFTDLRIGFLPGCITIATSAFDALPLEHQQALRQAAAKLLARIEVLGRSQDAQLLDGLFERQGLRRVTPSAAFRAELLEAARAAREQLGSRLAPPALIRQVTGWLDEYRTQHLRVTRER